MNARFQICGSPFRVKIGSLRPVFRDISITTSPGLGTGRGSGARKERSFTSITLFLEPARVRFGTVRTCACHGGGKVATPQFANGRVGVFFR